MLSTTVGAIVIGAHIHTHHFGNDAGKAPALRNHDSTPGFFVRAPEYPLLGGEPTAGVYRNSLGRTTAYGGLTWQTENKRWAASLALASGYRRERVIGDSACPPGVTLKPGGFCWADQGKANTRLMPIGALSVTFPEVKPYIGVTPRMLWIGKGLSLAAEWSLP